RWSRPSAVPGGRGAGRGSRAEQVPGQVLGDLVQRHALLAHRVTVADRHGLVVERVEVDRDAERRADLVLAAVTAADRAGVVEVDVPVPAQLGGEVLRLGR